MKTQIVTKVKKSNMFFATRAKARIAAASIKAEGHKVLSPVKCSDGWKIPHKGGTLSLKGC